MVRIQRFSSLSEDSQQESEKSRDLNHNIDQGCFIQYASQVIRNNLFVFEIRDLKNIHYKQPESTMRSSIPTIEDDPMMDCGYERQFGTYKPHFKGRHKDFYPFELRDYIGVILYVFLTWSFIIPIFYGVLEAGKEQKISVAKVSSAQLATVVFIGFIGFLLMIILGMYFFGSTKRNYSKEMADQKLKEIQMLEKHDKSIKL